MQERIVFAFVGPDRPGLVDRISQIVTSHEGSWRDSRSSRLAGQFAGVIEIDVPAARASGLQAALEGLTLLGLAVIVRRCEATGDEPAGPTRELHVLGPDRLGIVREVAHALAERGINVLAMTTRVFKAPMSGAPTFSADATVIVPDGVDVAGLEEALDEISHRLTVEIDLGAAVARAQLAE